MIKVGYFLLLVGLSSSLAKGLLMINQLLDWGYGLRPSYRLSKEQCWTSPCPSSRCLPEIWQTSRGDCLLFEFFIDSSQLVSEY